jgi:hypothetical protein
VLYLARADAPERHRGTVLRLEQSVFAPAAWEDTRRRTDRSSGPGRAADPMAFRIAYVAQLRALWRRDPGAFLRVIDQATGDHDVTLVDGWGDEPHAPRRILATALKQIARTRADATRRGPRRR